MNRLLGATLAVVALLSHPASGQAQAPTCTYERCALRLEDYRNPMLPARLVQGVEGRPVATIGVFASAIPLFATASDSIRIPYEAFRSRMKVSSGLLALSLVGFVAAPFVVHHSMQGPGSAVYWVVGGSLAAGITGMVVRAGGESKLDQAIARYNDALPDRR